VIVPTRYYSTPTEVFRQAGVSVVIWANHMVRAAIAAMQALSKELRASETLVNIEDRIASVGEIFRLQDAEEYSAAEELYLRASAPMRAAIVLAAGRGKGLEALTAERPKVMLPIAGKPLLRWLLDGFKREGINDVTVIGGYHAEAIDPSGVRLLLNERYEVSDELVSLSRALDTLSADTVICYGDLLFRSYVLRDLLDCRADFAVVVDSSDSAELNSTVRDFAYCSRRDDRGLFGGGVLLERIASRNGAAAPAASGRWIGMLYVRGSGVPRLKSVMAQLAARADFDQLDVPALLNALVADGAAVEVRYVHGHWRGVNDLEELRQAVDFAHGQDGYGSGGADGSRQ
jgi:phosphoenolpyruvate phosphomutase